jgi:hypothetical protein
MVRLYFTVTTTSPSDCAATVAPNARVLRTGTQRQCSALDRARGSSYAKVDTRWLGTLPLELDR